MDQKHFTAHSWRTRYTVYIIFAKLKQSPSSKSSIRFVKVLDCYFFNLFDILKKTIVAFVDELNTLIHSPAVLFATNFLL